MLVQVVWGRPGGPHSRASGKFGGLRFRALLPWGLLPAGLGGLGEGGVGGGHAPGPPAPLGLLPALPRPQHPAKLAHCLPQALLLPKGEQKRPFLGFSASEAEVQV